MFCAAASAEDFRQLRPGRIDAFDQLGGIETADRMFDDQKLRLHFASLGLCQHQGTERIRGDHISRDAALFEFNAVVETPR